MLPKTSPNKSPCEGAPAIPLAAKTLLDRNFPGWQFPFVSNDIRRFLKEHVSMDARPEVVQGDFDGDGQIDYAVLIEYGMATVHETPPPISSSPDHDVLEVILLKRAGGYEMHRVGEGGEYLQLMEEGAAGYDYELDRPFHYANDAIFAGYFEKGGTSYVYENGEFKAIVTGD